MNSEMAVELEWNVLKITLKHIKAYRPNAHLLDIQMQL